MKAGFKEDMQVFEVLYDDEMWTAGEETDREQKCSMEDALILSINRFGRVNLPFMAESSGRTEEEIISAMEGEMIWRDPSCYDPKEPYKGWVMKTEYVRGNIFTLLNQARENNDNTGLFDSNIALLEANLPEVPPAEDIAVMLGATWVPAEYYVAFISDLLGLRKEDVDLSYDNYFKKWVIKARAVYSYLRNTSTYGTERMHAVKIIDKTMNAQTVKVYDRIENPVTGKKKAVINMQETAAAQEKQQLIIREFQNWLLDHPKDVAKLRDIYADKFCYKIPHYDGSFLTLPGMNPGIRLYSHQRAAVGRILLSPDNVLLNHEVGAGKTYALAAGIHERLRTGLSRKALYVVPNAVLGATVKAFNELYPGEEIDAIYPKDFVPKKRGEVLDRIGKAESGVFIMAFSSFDFIDMSGCFKLEQLENEIAVCEAEISANTDYLRGEKLNNKLSSLTEARDELSEEYVYKDTDCFDVLGIDLLVVDECHNYKNITISSMDAVAGMSTTGSKKADCMLTKCDFVRHNGGKIVFATGTPITNSMAELFVLQRYLQPMDLEILKISRFNDWINTFSMKHTEFEVDPTAASFRYVSRFDSFHNLPELMSIFGNVCDFYTIDKEELGLPEFKGCRNITVPRSVTQKEYIDEIVERTRKIRYGEVSSKEDNYLKITSDGRKCALDIRLVNPDADERSCRNSKAAVVASNIKRIYAEYPGTTQAVFCDLSTPSKEFNVYDEVKRLLVKEGIPESEIAFIHDAKTEKNRQKLLSAFNNGTIRILLGSTLKLGTGVNIQKHLVALHHLDAPWKPADLIQREGRAIRQGNSNSEVFVYRYVTESSFDAYIWQILENKQRFLASFLSGSLDSSKRSESDIGEMVLDYAEIKALAIGNPLIRERIKVNTELVRARSASYRRRQELLKYQGLLSELPGKCERLRKQFNVIKSDYRRCKAQNGPASKDDRELLGSHILEAIRKGAGMRDDQDLCMYRGFHVIIPAGMGSDKPYLLLTRGSQSSYRVEMKDAKAAGCCTRLDNVLNSLPARMDEVQARIAGCESMLIDAEIQVKAGNPMDKKVNKLTKKLLVIDNKLRKEIED